jgi:hypothetical protein
MSVAKIHDRHSIISEYVYSSVFNKKPMDNTDINSFKWLIQNTESLVIYARPSNPSFGFHRVSTRDTPAKLEELKTNYNDLVFFYDVLMSDFPNVIKFDFQKPNTDMFNLIAEKITHHFKKFKSL